MFEERSLANPDAVGDSYRFLISCERTARQFSLEELCQATGWKRATPRAYLSKKWGRWITDAGNGYRVSGLSAYSEDEYRRYMSQKQDVSQEPTRPELPNRVERLVLKARQAAVLALDIYNRPGTEFRTEGYVVMMVVAWTAALQAIFERNGVDYIHRDEDGNPVLIDGDPKAWALTDCLRKHFGDGTPPARRNLDFIIGLRNKIEHRYVPAIDAKVAGECQALLLNLDRLFSSEFGDYYSVSDSLSVPLQTSTLRSTSRSDAMRELQANHYDEVMEYVESFRSDLPDAVYSDPSYSFRVYLIPKVGNHESSSDLAFEFVKYDPQNPDDMKALERQVTLIRERQVPVANAGKYKPGIVAEKVAERLGLEFSIHHHTCAWKYYKVRASGIDPEQCKVRFCQFDAVHNDYIYTDDWINFLVDELSDPVQYKAVTTFRP